MNKNKAIFWDRDGVLNHVVSQRADGEQNVSPQVFADFKLVDGVAEILQQARAKGYLNIIATKQPDIARNKMSWEELNKMHDFLKNHVPTIDAIYVCPHDKKDNCQCRKPLPGLLFDAAKDYHLDLTQCYMVGDSQSDIDAGHNAGAKSILVNTHYNTNVRGFDWEIKNISDILNLI